VQVHGLHFHLSGNKMVHRRLRSLAIGNTVAALVLATLVGPAANVTAQQAPAFTCTEVIGFSQSEQWYDGGFIASVANPGNWQLRWYSGGSVDLWADPNFAGWNSSALVSQCSQGSSTPDRVVMNVSGDYHNDPNWWAQQTQQVIQNIRAASRPTASVSMVRRRPAQHSRSYHRIDLCRSTPTTVAQPPVRSLCHLTARSAIRCPWEPAS
jgi:hypothetical protein